MLGHNTLRKHLHSGGHKRPVKKAYVHQASKGSNPLGILFYCQLSSDKTQFRLYFHTAEYRMPYVNDSNIFPKIQTCFMLTEHNKLSF
jgi:hypothetical protein